MKTINELSPEVKKELKSLKKSIDTIASNKACDWNQIILIGLGKLQEGDLRILAEDVKTPEQKKKDALKMYNSSNSSNLTQGQFDELIIQHFMKAQKISNTESIVN
jgi:hypothetical protein